MKKRFLFLVMMLAAPDLSADILVPVRTIRAKEIISAEDLEPKVADIEGALSDVRDIVGMEARVALYPGRPVRHEDVGPPAIIGRNDVVTIVFFQGGLRIETEGRALGRGALGETIRVMNLSSRTTVTGRVSGDGSIEVQ
jgi:flagella basal body P-ring formation protein FlgA